MKAIKIRSCFQCSSETLYRNRVMIDCPVISMDVPYYEPHLHDDCPLQTYPDIEAIRELCKKHIDDNGQYNWLRMEILSIIGINERK